MIWGPSFWSGLKSSKSWWGTPGIRRCDCQWASCKLAPSSWQQDYLFAISGITWTREAACESGWDSRALPARSGTSPSSGFQSSSCHTQTARINERVLLEHCIFQMQSVIRVCQYKEGLLPAPDILPRSHRWAQMYFPTWKVKKKRPWRLLSQYATNILRKPVWGLCTVLSCVDILKKKKKNLLWKMFKEMLCGFFMFLNHYMTNINVQWSPLSLHFQQCRCCKFGLAVKSFLRKKGRNGCLTAFHSHLA